MAVAVDSPVRVADMLVPTSTPASQSPKVDGALPRHRGGRDASATSHSGAAGRKSSTARTQDDAQPTTQTREGERNDQGDNGVRRERGAQSADRSAKAHKSASRKTRRSGDAEQARSAETAATPVFADILRAVAAAAGPAMIADGQATGDAASDASDQNAARLSATIAIPVTGGVQAPTLPADAAGRTTADAGTTRRLTGAALVARATAARPPAEPLATNHTAATIRPAVAPAATEAQADTAATQESTTDQAQAKGQGTTESAQPVAAPQRQVASESVVEAAESSERGDQAGRQLAADDQTHAAQAATGKTGNPAAVSLHPAGAVINESQTSTAGTDSESAPAKRASNGTEARVEASDIRPADRGQRLTDDALSAAGPVETQRGQASQKFRQVLESQPMETSATSAAASATDASVAAVDRASTASAPATEPASAGSAQQPGVARQLADGFSHEGGRVGDQVVIRLNPPELGQVRMTLRDDGTGLRAVLEVQNPRTLGEIRKETDSLIQRLSDSGVQVRRIDVVLHTAATGQGSQAGSDASGRDQAAFQSAANANGQQANGQAGQRGQDFTDRQSSGGEAPASRAAATAPVPAWQLDDSLAAGQGLNLMM